MLSLYQMKLAVVGLGYVSLPLVVESALSKWNILYFRSGLVGGHCIGVELNYCTHKAQAIGYHPESLPHVAP